MSRLLLATIGTRGDVEPFVALARGLGDAGHDVVLATSPSFEDFVVGHGVEYQKVRADSYRLLERRDVLKAMRNPLRAGRILRHDLRPMMCDLMEDVWHAAQGCDAIVYHPRVLGPLSVGEKLGIPAIAGLMMPGMAPTYAFENPGIAYQLPSVLRLSPRWRYETYRLFAASIRIFQPEVDEWRHASLGLAPRRDSELTLPDGSLPTMLHAFSPLVVPRPDDWPEDVHVTGFWFLDADAGWDPPPALAEFLARPGPVVAVGFGSMPFGNVARTVRAVVSAVSRSGVRAVFVTGRNVFEPPDRDDVLFVSSVPNHWLFPRVDAVVHHGGAGTTAAALRAGKPMVVLPVFGDQPFWGRRVHSLGVAPAPERLRTIDGNRLSWLVDAVVGDRRYRQRAAAVGERIRSEDGVGTAVKLIESYLL